MKITQLKIPKDSYLRSENALFAIFSVVTGVISTVAIAIVLFQIPESGNLWIALAICLWIVIFSVGYLKSDIRHKRRRDQASDGDNTA